MPDLVWATSTLMTGQENEALSEDMFINAALGGSGVSAYTLGLKAYQEGRLQDATR